MGSGTSKPASNKTGKQKESDENNRINAPKSPKTDIFGSSHHPGGLSYTGLAHEVVEGPERGPGNGNVTNGTRTFTKVGTRQWSVSSLSRGTVTPLTGVAWRLSPKLESYLLNKKTMRIPDIRCKSKIEIDNEYRYPFDLERRLT